MKKKTILSKTKVLGLSIIILFASFSNSYAAFYNDIEGYTIEINNDQVYIRNGNFVNTTCNNPGWLTLCSHNEPSCKAKTSLALTAFTANKKLWLFFGTIDSCPTTNYQKIDNVMIH